MNCFYQLRIANDPIAIVKCASNLQRLNYIMWMAKSILIIRRLEWYWLLIMEIILGRIRFDRIFFSQIQKGPLNYTAPLKKIPYQSDQILLIFYWGYHTVMVFLEKKTTLVLSAFCTII